MLSVYYGVARWNDYFTGLVFIRNRAYLPLQTVLREILASLSISGSSDTFFAAYADNLGGLQEAMRKAEVAKYCCIVVSTVPAIVLYLHAEVFRQGRHDWVAEGIILSNSLTPFHCIALLWQGDFAPAGATRGLSDRPLDPFGSPFFSDFTRPQRRDESILCRSPRENGANERRFSL